MPETLKEIIAEAKDAENSEDTETAIKLYEQALQQDKLNEHAYSRLMIIYRRLKDKKKEYSMNFASISEHKKMIDLLFGQKSSHISSVMCFIGISKAIV